MEGVGLIHPKKADQFFEEYHKSLRSMGVDGVKVDAQALVSSLAGDRYGCFMVIAYCVHQSTHVSTKSRSSNMFVVLDLTRVHQIVSCTWYFR